MALHVRIDDRLMHGQVAHGVLPAIGATSVIVADDTASADEWERETYLASGSGDVEVCVTDLDGAARRVPEAMRGGASVLLLVRGPEELLGLVERGLEVSEAVVGGLHRAPGRMAFADDLQIGPAEARAFAALTNLGVRCYHQPLPTDRPSELPDLRSVTNEESGE